MFRRVAKLLLFCLCACPILLHAQDFKLFDRDVQVHGFVSQGYVYTSGNNWLSMNSNGDGSAAFTDMGLNMSSPITDKLRIGAQVYDRNLGQLGQYHPQLDWAFADYRFATWFGVRGGKVKTVLGLYNDTQDLDFLHTFALLPQSIYPTDLRDVTIAHLGGDIYGDIRLKNNLGTLSYTAYIGHRSDSIYDGYPLLLSSQGVYIKTQGGLQYGADLRWKTPLKGLLIGISRINQDITATGLTVNQLDPTGPLENFSSSSKAEWTNQFYGQYTRKKLQIDSEYRRYFTNFGSAGNPSGNINDVRAWYVSGAYRIIKKLEVGSYYSHYTIESIYYGPIAAVVPSQTDTSLPANHVYDKVITARVDINKFWNVKVEGHFMDGYGVSTYPDGFYPQENPQGFKNNTNALVVKTGLHF
jgi:hypothetical protein